MATGIASCVLTCDPRCMWNPTSSRFRHEANKATAFRALSSQTGKPNLESTMPVLIYELVSRPGADNYGMALAASVVLGLVTVTVMAAVERLRLATTGTF